MCYYDSSSGEKRLEINTEGKHNWKDVCQVMYDSTIQPHLREFQFKILHNYLPLNDKLYKWKIYECFRCSYCFISAESAMHLFCHCLFTKNLYLEITRPRDLMLTCERIHLLFDLV